MANRQGGIDNKNDTCNGFGICYEADEAEHKLIIWYLMHVRLNMRCRRHQGGTIKPSDEEIHSLFAIFITMIMPLVSSDLFKLRVAYKCKSFFFF